MGGSTDDDVGCAASDAPIGRADFGPTRPTSGPGIGEPRRRGHDTRHPRPRAPKRQEPLVYVHGGVVEATRFIFRIVNEALPLNSAQADCGESPTSALALLQFAEDSSAERMNGVIIYSGQYGSTDQYSRWISEDTGLPVFRIDDPGADPSTYDFVVLGSSVMYYRASIRGWVKANWPDLQARPLVLFTVSGAPAGAQLDGWIAKSFPQEVLARMEHVPLRGRLNYDDVSWWLRLLLRMEAMTNRDPQARREAMHGFDYMDRSAIEPIVRLIQRYPTSGEPTP
jgi:menaquinone-dependent protoporphyrinogen IX oxidase